ncbi:DEAD/DEAH box helicase family protein [Rheinheimera sp. UJ51]|uniref:EcoAI/FtnUII family type I restriction enzme subunit R n=1 Tax=Rheinheimera sp. UJ51 TaxID=2892446 RepID=UPI001E6332E7|nr:DEAD/DEAH box helicase family protein [Rheinheimera sp. UJ51]MCC5453370.1 DEAD/DEAH box helicase family protein [Rheinheimera sp. UJ51]
MNKKALSERDICSKFITPAIVQAGWDLQTQIREELTFTAGRVIVRGRMHSRGEKRRADYVLFHKKNLPLAVIEAKDNKHSLGAGMQQALAYSEALDVLFVFSSNGDGFLFHDKTGLSGKTEQELALNAFPSAQQLWQWYCQYHGFKAAAVQLVDTPYYDDGSGRSPRYYQMTAINRTVEAVARGQNRILLVMATGTGKTYTAFQIIWRLWKSKQKKRILFLADRNILVDQTKNNDFKPFGQAMTKITKRTINKSYEIYLSLYQAVTGTEEEQNIYREFSPDFFDLIVIDECHRGSAREDSAWRDILDYFKSATHIGLTATPKETKDVSNIHYFGEPIFTYSLKQGIDDGFLAPYKVVRIDFDIDLFGWRPKKGQKDKYGLEIEDRIYNQKDMDRNIVFDERTQLVAQKVTEYLQKTGEFQKTIIFCDDIDHAERMRQALVNLNPARVKESSKYIMRITGDDNEGKAELDNFINPESRYPVIATTSKLMTTGVDAQTCKLVVLDQRIQSMTEFKQIIGRGTRINEDFGKLWFTIMDFKKATELFADPAFDGDPVVIYNPKPGDDPEPPAGNDGGVGDEDPGYGATVGDGETGDDGSGLAGIDVGGGGEKKKKFFVAGHPVMMIGERVQFLGPDGKLITESLTDYTKECVQKQFATLKDFFRHWSSAERKHEIIQQLAEHGVFWDELRAEVEQKLGTQLDAFDLIAHIVYDAPPLTRRERANNVKKRNYFTKYQGAALQVLENLLEKYADTGIAHIEDIKILQLPPFNTMGTMVELVNAFGGKAGYEQALHELEQALYDDKNIA